MQFTEVFVRDQQPNPGDNGKSVWIMMTDDTDGPITSVTKLVSAEEAAGDYDIGKAFRLLPMDTTIGTASVE